MTCPLFKLMSETFQSASPLDAGEFVCCFTRSSQDMFYTPFNNAFSTSKRTSCATLEDPLSPFLL